MTESNILIAYFSKSKHTQKTAEYISHQTGGTLHEIITEKTYSKNYFMTILEARREFNHNERPSLVSKPIENFYSYEKILLGFPIWFGTCPMAIVTFLEYYDFSGRDIYPFCTSSISGCTKASAKIRELCPGAKVHDGLRINTPEKINLSEWLDSTKHSA